MKTRAKVVLVFEMNEPVTQRFSRYFFLLNLFGFFLVSIAALEAAEADAQPRCSGSCIFSCAEAEQAPSIAFDLQPILGAAIAHAEDSEQTRDITAAPQAATPFASLETLAIAPKQSPPARA